MKTSHLISTISYNSVEFLKSKLNEMYKAHKIAFWCFVQHMPEELDDHTWEKPHIHLFVEPNCALDTMDLQKETEEFDPVHPDLPLKTIYWRKSDWENWLLYAMHDETYLHLKLEKREFCYEYGDFYYSDSDEFFERYNAALHSSTISEMMRLPKLLKEHSVAELVALGYVQPAQSYNFAMYEKLLARGKEELSHKRSHE